MGNATVGLNMNGTRSPRDPKSQTKIPASPPFYEDDVKAFYKAERDEWRAPTVRPSVVQNPVALYATRFSRRTIIVIVIVIVPDYKSRLETVALVQSSTYLNDTR